jgi:hypothetical protein
LIQKLATRVEAVKYSIRLPKTSVVHEGVSFSPPYFLMLVLRVELPRFVRFDYQLELILSSLRLLGVSIKTIPM